MNCSRLQRIDDLLAVKATVFYKNVAGVSSANDHTRQMDPRHVAFKRVGVKRRLSRIGIEPHAKAFDKSVVGMITGQSEYLFCRQSLLARAILHDNFIPG